MEPLDVQKEFNSEKIEEIIKSLIIAFGGDINSEGLKETPQRATKMLIEMLEGMLYTNDEIANKYDKCFEFSGTNNLVLIKDISMFSFCEHHFALMYNMKVDVGYLPNGKIIGLSKIIRIVEMVGKRLQLQERIGIDISYILKKILGTEDVIVVIEGEHSCVNARGIRAKTSKTRTIAAYGAFYTNYNLRCEVYCE